MKYLKAFGRHVGFFIIIITGLLVIIYFLDNKSWWAFPSFILTVILGISYLKLVTVKKCPKCGGKGKPTNVAGNQYKQWYCTNCKNTFWTTLFLEDYE